MNTLVAGIGNLFLGDDAFGVEVVQRLAGQPLPEGTRVRDFGVGGLHLAYELLEGYGLIVLIDLAPRGGPPGMVYVIDPELDGLPQRTADGHGMDLSDALAAARMLGATLGRIRLVGCEPARVEAGIGLSEAVQHAVDDAVGLVRELIEQERARSLREAAGSRTRAAENAEKPP